jgi:hypothetical protein
MHCITYCLEQCYTIKPTTTSSIVFAQAYNYTTICRNFSYMHFIYFWKYTVHYRLSTDVNTFATIGFRTSLGI